MAGYKTVVLCFTLIILVSDVSCNDAVIDAERNLINSEQVIQNGQEIASKEPFDTIQELNRTNVELKDDTVTTVEEYYEIYHCQVYNLTGEYCEACFDGITLWSRVRAGEEVQSPCPTDKSIPTLPGYASRYCNKNGTWALKANYSVCISGLQKHIDKKEETEKQQQRVLMVLTNTVYIFLAGFSLSNVSMITAIIIIVRYKHLRCLRNLIHSQLLLGMTIKNFLWMVLMCESLQEESIYTQPTRCKIFITVYKFFHISQYAWMFIEGLYLFIVVVNAMFTNGLRFKHCLLIGWGIPVLVIAASITSNLLLSNDLCWNVGYITAANAIEVVSISLLLVVNVIFMTVVIYTLVRKLQNSALNEAKQYRKAVKATTILVPLLGGTYIMIFYSPDGTASYSEVWFYFNAVMQSTQGFIVALVYCFLNAEVKTSIIKSHRRWKDEQTLPSSDWWGRKRRSSYAVTRCKEDTTETDTTTYSSRRNSRRVSEDTVSSSRRGSHVPDIVVDLAVNKHFRKASPLALQQQPLVETHSSCVYSNTPEHPIKPQYHANIV